MISLLRRIPVAAVLLSCSLALASMVPATVMAAGSRVSGQVLDAGTQAPVGNADIELQNSGGGPGYFRTRTNAKGEFAVDNVPADRWYLVTVSADGYTDWAIESWQFPAAQREVRLAIPLDRAGKLDVFTRGSDGKPVVAARITVRRDRGSNWWEAYRRDPEPRWTGRDGHVVFEGLSGGPWSVSVEAAGLRGEEARAVPVQRGQVTPATLTLTRPGSFSGVVRLPDSTRVSGVNVVVRGPAEGTGTTDEDGAWTVADLPPGRYRAEISYDGFTSNGARDGLVLAEGESKGGVVLTGLPRAQSLAFVLERDVFVPQLSEEGGMSARPSLGVRAFRIAALDLVLYRVPFARLLGSARGQGGVNTLESDTTGLERVHTWRYDLPDGAPFAWREAQLTLPLDLAPGAYVLAGSAGRLQRRQLFFVSDLSLVVKRSGTKLAAWVGSLRTGLALPGVSLYVQPGAPAGESADEARRASAALTGKAVVTDGDGLAWLTPPALGGAISVVAAGERAGIAVVQPPLAADQVVSGDKLFLFTERPLYRPGQKLHWKAFARRAAGAGYVLPNRTQVQLTLRGPDQEVSVPTVTLSASGAASGDIDLPADAPLGEWSLSAASGRAAGTASFGVQDYRKPEFKVEVTPDRKVALNGDDVRFKVAASYFFGAPVVGATVRYTLFESRLGREPRWDDWDPWGDGGDGGGGEGGGYGRLLQSGETRTDLDGGVSLPFTPARAAYDRKLVLEVEVLDGAQRVVSARGTALVGRGQFTLRIEPVSRMLMAGAPIVADVFAQDLLGKPVQAAVTIELDQDVWNPIERRTSKSARPLATLQGTTSALRGNVRATLSPATARAGYLTVRARAQDARGNKLVSECHIWVYDARVWDYGYRYPAFEAVPDRDSWAPGDTARILVNTDVKDAAILVSVEGRELHELRVVHLFGRTGLVLVPIREGYGPNVFVKLHVRRGREVRTRTLELPVQSTRHDLAITVTPDRASYRPQELAKLVVETRDAAGKPVPAEVAVGVVDEALYALRADATPKSHDVFYGRIADAVTTVAAFPVLFYGGAGKGDAGSVRRDFRDVAAWAPDVRTGADGRAQVELKWPDNLTTWRATARGVSDGTLVGESVAKTLVSKDVVARLAVPRTFTAGDEAQLVSVVTNRTGQPLAGVKQAIEVSGAARLTGPATATTGIATGGEARARWNVMLPAEPARDGGDAIATFTFRATSAADADALEQSVPVRPRAVALRLHASGTLAPGTPSVSVNLPADLIASGSRVTITAPRSARALLTSAANWLGDYRYGCTEQTANKLRALLAAAGPGADRDALAHDVLPYVQRLAALKASDGGWGWWPGGDSDPYMSALAVDALSRCAARGVQSELALQTLTSAQYTLLRQSASVRSLDGEAYFAMLVSNAPAAPALAELRAGLDGVLGSIVAQREQLSPGALACATLACARTLRTPDAAVLLDAMWARSVLANGARSLPGGGDDEWLGDEVEHTAWALEAAALLAPADPRTAQLLAWLAAHRDGREWRSTRATGSVVVALAAWLEKHPEPSTVAPARVRWNGEALTANSAGEFVVPNAKLKPGANALEIRAEGAAPTWWSWSALANVPSPGPAPDKSRLSVSREYLRAVRTADRRGRPRWLTTAIDDKQPLRVGEGVLVRLTLSASKDLRWLAIEDAVPGGFEIDQIMPEGVDRPWNAHGEARDGSAAFFLDQLGEGTTVIEYLVRPEIAGTFTALPTSAFGMYDPALGTRSGEARLRVVNP